MLWGGESIFSAIVSALLAVEIYKLFVKFKITLRLPPQVPSAISDSFQVLTPLLFIGIVFGSLRHLLGFDLNSFLAISLATTTGYFNEWNYGGYNNCSFNFLLLILWYSWSFHYWISGYAFLNNSYCN